MHQYNMIHNNMNIVNWIKVKLKLKVVNNLFKNYLVCTWNNNLNKN